MCAESTGPFYKNALGSTGRGVISESDHPVDQAKDPGGKDSIEDDRTCDRKDFRTNTENLSFFFIFNRRSCNRVGKAGDRDERTAAGKGDDFLIDVEAG